MSATSKWVRQVYNTAVQQSNGYTQSPTREKPSERPLSIIIKEPVHSRLEPWDWFLLETCELRDKPFRMSSMGFAIDVFKYLHGLKVSGEARDNWNSLLATRVHDVDANKPAVQWQQRYIFWLSFSTLFRLWACAASVDQLSIIRLERDYVPDPACLPLSWNVLDSTQVGWLCTNTMQQYSAKDRHVIVIWCKHVPK